MTCGYYKGVFIPDCWGGVQHGKAGCYCRPPLDPEAMLLRIEKLEQQVQTLMDEKSKEKPK